MSKKNILFMDDDVIFRTEVAGLLVRNGYDVTCCSTATEAKDYLKTGQFDLVISDIFIRSDDQFISDGGVSLLGWMQTNKKLPTIAITGLVDQQGGGFLQNMKELGADVCLSKPLDMTAFLKEVSKLTAKVGARS